MVTQKLDQKLLGHIDEDFLASTGSPSDGLGSCYGVEDRISRKKRRRRYGVLVHERYEA